MFTQLVTPNTNVKDNAGMCLRFVQSVYGAPVKYASATDAANATKMRYDTQQMPNVSVPVWFDHWGTYGSPARYANWGHVVAWIPNKGFLSSPGSGYGQQWFGSIRDVELYFKAAFRFWSLDINGLQVASDSGSGSGFLFGDVMRIVAGQPSNRRFALGELTYQELPMDQASHSAHIWESQPGGKGTAEPMLIDDADLDLEIGQIQKRRAQLADAFKHLGV